MNIRPKSDQLSILNFFEAFHTMQSCNHFFYSN